MKFTNIISIIIFFTYFSGHKGQETRKQTIYVGQSAKLICGSIDKFYNIPIKYRWEKPVGNVIGTDAVYHLKNVDFKDGGIYTCRIFHRINNEFVEKTVSTELAISRRDDSEGGSLTNTIDPPIIRFKDAKKEIIELSETDFIYESCDVSNWLASEYTTRWLFNKAPLNGADNVLFVSPLDSQKNSGMYTCQIVHKSNPDQKYEKYLVINIKKPEIVITSFPEENLRIGGRIYRKCEIAESKNPNNNQIQISWLKDNYIEVASGNILDVRITDPSVAGEYSCVIRSAKLNKKYSKLLYIKVDNSGFQPSEQQKISISNQPSNPEFDKEFKMKCQVYPAIPNASYRWRKDNQIISTEQTLVIPSFKKKDIGSYTCEIVSPDGSTTSMGRTPSENVNVNVPVTSNSKIELDESGSQMVTRIGEKKELHCEISSSSNNRGENVEWLFNNRPVTDYTKQQYRIHRSDRTYVSIITLTNIFPENEGQYTCKVDGTVKRANIIVLQEEPSLTINPEKLIRKEGEPAEFHCRGNNIINFSNNKIVWSFRSRNGQIIKSSFDNDPRWEKTNNPETIETSFISVMNTKYEDDGFYTCTSPDGKQRTAELIIKKKEDDIVLTISPEVVKVRDGQPVIVECFSVSQKTGEPYGEPRFTMEAGRSLSEDPRLKENTVGQSRIRLQIKEGLQSPENKLKVECHAGIQVRSALIFLENQCPPNYRLCTNGECQPSGKFCDGIRDCSDGSDEVSSVCNKCDPLVTKCEYYQNKAPIKDTYLVHWNCDGENDCGNNFDESQCEEDNKCGNLRFNCSNGKVIPRAYRCDKEPDCFNGDDENGCSLPQVSTIPGDKIKRIRRGYSIELKCESYGVPKSFVVWRHNWGCLRDKTRMYVSTTQESCNKIVSTLRIINFQPGDDGIYNCEALSGQNRSFSDDYQLLLESI